MSVENSVKNRTSLLVDEHSDFDEIDKAPSGFHVTKLDIFALIYSIVLHIIDVGFDINLAIHYYNNKLYVYFVLTIVFMFVPASLITSLSLRMYYQDKKERPHKVSVSGKAVQWKFICLLVFLLQLAPVMRYCESLNFALRSRRAEKNGDKKTQEEHYRDMLGEDCDVALLRVFECYLESAPQQILQITLLLLEPTSGSAIQQGFSIASSFVSMAWCIASYNRSIRFHQDNKNNISWTGTVVQFLWHLNVTISRIIAISVIATISPLWTVFGVGVHWILMTCFLAIIIGSQQNLRMKTPFRGTLIDRRPFYPSFGLVCIFNYMRVVDGPSRYKHAFFYSLCFVENVAAISLWSYFVDDATRATWYYLPLNIIPIVTFLLGMILLVMYYLCFRPAKDGLEKLDNGRVVANGNTEGVLQ